MARLVAESGSLLGKEWKIDPGLTLGREAHNSIGMPDNKKSSRDHAKVWREGPGRYAVVDLGSTNGTQVNDDRISGRHGLVDGDELRVGEVTFRFVLDDDEKPKKKEPAARLQEVFGNTGGGGGTAGGMGIAGSPSAASDTGGKAVAGTIEVKSRILQYSKKKGGGSAVQMDLGQAAGGQKWLLILAALAVTGGIFYLVMTLVRGGGGE